MCRFIKSVLIRIFDLTFCVTRRARNSICAIYLIPAYSAVVGSFEIFKASKQINRRTECHWGHRIWCIRWFVCTPIFSLIIYIPPVFTFVVNARVITNTILCTICRFRRNQWALCGLFDRASSWKALRLTTVEVSKEAILPFWTVTVVYSSNKYWLDNMKTSNDIKQRWTEQ